VPQDVVFQTKPELAWAMLEHAWALGMPGRWVTADTVYGQDPVLRQRLDACVSGGHYVLAIPATTPVWLERPPATSASADAVRVTRTWMAQTAARVATSLAATAWRRISSTYRITVSRTQPPVVTAIRPGSSATLPP